MAVMTPYEFDLLKAVLRGKRPERLVTSTLAKFRLLKWIEPRWPNRSLEYVAFEDYRLTPLGETVLLEAGYKPEGARPGRRQAPWWDGRGPKTPKRGN